MHIRLGHSCYLVLLEVNFSSVCFYLKFSIFQRDHSLVRTGHCDNFGYHSIEMHFNFWRAGFFVHLGLLFGTSFDFSNKHSCLERKKTVNLSSEVKWRKILCVLSIKWYHAKGKIQSHEESNIRPSGLRFISADGRCPMGSRNISLSYARDRTKKHVSLNNNYFRALLGLRRFQANTEDHVVHKVPKRRRRADLLWIWTHICW